MRRAINSCWALALFAAAAVQRAAICCRQALAISSSNCLRLLLPEPPSLLLTETAGEAARDLDGVIWDDEMPGKCCVGGEAVCGDAAGRGELDTGL